MLPRDLDAEELYGRDHMQTLLSMVSHGDRSTTFVSLAKPFLSVITHPTMLDCLSVDTFVGNLYSFISGSNGTRIFPFLQRLCKALADTHCESTKESSEATLGMILTSLREILKREQRAAFNENLPNLVTSLEIFTGITGIVIDTASRLQPIINQIAEIRTIIARAKGLLNGLENTSFNSVSTT